MNTIELPKSRIQEARAELWSALRIRNKTLRNQAYASVVRAVSHPVAVVRGRVVRGTRLLQSLLNLLLLLHYVSWCTYLAAVVVAIRGTIGALIVIPLVLFFQFVLLSNIQTRINVELAARLKVLDDLMESDSAFRERALAAMEGSKG